MAPYPRYADVRSSWTPSWPGVGVVVTADDGTQGLGISTLGRPLAALVDDYLGPRIVGEPALATERIYDMMLRLCSPFGATGIASYAVSAIDLALWDLKGKVLDRPVYELLGGPARDEIVCYATGPQHEWHMELGFTATKHPCRYGPSDGLDGLRGNVDDVAAVRDLVGPDVELMLDCWMSLDVEYAVRLIEELRPFKLKWIEEALRSEDMDSHAELRRRVPWQTLATGEHWYTPVPFQHAASRRLVDVLQPDVMWVGGITALMRICAIADAAGLAVIPPRRRQRALRPARLLRPARHSLGRILRGLRSRHRPRRRRFRPCPAPPTPSTAACAPPTPPASASKSTSPRSSRTASAIRAATRAAPTPTISL